VHRTIGMDAQRVNAHIGSGTDISCREPAKSWDGWAPMMQPFAIGDRVIVVANQHLQRKTVDLVGRTGNVHEVSPSPIADVVDRGALLDGARPGGRQRGRHPAGHGRPAGWGAVTPPPHSSRRRRRTIAVRHPQHPA
jgi:hypothetical protein